MSLPAALLSFAVIAGLVTIIPGLDTALVLRTAIAQGTAPAFATALGITTGTLIWGATAAIGVSALLTASSVAFTAVRIAGALYMVWLGSRLLRASLHRGGGDGIAEETVAIGGGALRSWGRGLLTNVLNPKVGAFYVAMLPQFIPAHTPHLAVGLLLALVHDVEGIAWFTAIILGAQSIRAALHRRSVRRATDGITGATLIGFGVKLGLSSS